MRAITTGVGFVLALGVGAHARGAAALGPTLPACTLPMPPESRWAKTVPIGGAATSIDKSLIQSVVRAHHGDLRTCYEDGLRRDETLSGRMSVTWTMQAGVVVDTTLVETSLNDPCVVTCVLDEVGTWEFPEFSSSGTIRISYPFVFGPA
ncbi:MAG: AgmX/PglI C-terminal domain-containing protein [Nannocystaceae bacterium]|nr:AgmX/PglI C-terminal domain-containing protein [Nannocystaceae bacterium]